MNTIILCVTPRDLRRPYVIFSTLEEYYDIVREMEIICDTLGTDTDYIKYGDHTIDALDYDDDLIGFFEICKPYSYELSYWYTQLEVWKILSTSVRIKIVEESRAKYGSFDFLVSKIMKKQNVFQRVLFRFRVFWLELFRKPAGFVFRAF